MTMGLRAIFEAATPDIFQSVGEGATYNRVGYAPVSCMVFIEFNVDLQPVGVETQVWVRGTTIEALLSTSAGIGIGTSIPERGDVFIVGGISYSVREITDNDGLTVRMVVA
jgi:hypothetical protein